MNNEMGAIEAVSEKENKYGILIRGKWFNGLGKLPMFAKKGTMVTIKYFIDDKQINCIRDIRVTEPAIKPIDSKTQESIIRSVSLKCAAQIAPPNTTPEQLIELAKRLENYLRGV